MPYLYHIKSGGQPECWVINEEPLVLGRGDSVDAYVEDDALSRSHFLIVPEHEEYFAIDLNSSNGTWIDDELVCARKLESGDVILAGDSSFYFSFQAVASDQLPTLLLPARQTGATSCGADAIESASLHPRPIETRSHVGCG